MARPVRQGFIITTRLSVDQKQLRVVIVEDHEITRNGIAAVLGRAGIVTVGEAGTGGEATEIIERERPDVVLLDIRLPDQLGIETLRAIRERFPDVPVMILTSHSDPHLVEVALDSGADGFLLKRIESAKLPSFVRRVAAGERVLDPDVVQLMEQAEAVRDQRLGALSPRELEVLELVAQGLTNRELAQRLSLSEKTAKNYVSSMLKKLRINTRSGAAAYMARIQAGNELRFPPEG